MKSSLLVGLDTSVVLRLLVGEPRDQADRAIEKLDQIKAEGQRAAVSDLVVSEAYFALQHHYEVPKQQALDALMTFLKAPEIVATGVALRILQQPRLGRSRPGFVDRMIHAQYLQATSGMVSFEKAAGKLPGVMLP